MPVEPTLLDQFKTLRDRVAILERKEQGAWARDGSPLEQLRQTYLGNTGTGVASLASNEAMVCCDLWRSMAKSIPNNAATAVDFDTELRDYGNMWAVANPSRIVIRLPGPYVIFAQSIFDTSANGIRRLRIIRDGSIYLAIDENPAPSGATYCTLGRCRSVYIEAPCYLEMRVYQNSGGPLDLLSSAQYSPAFGAVLVRGG